MTWRTAAHAVGTAARRSARVRVRRRARRMMGRKHSVRPSAREFLSIYKPSIGSR
jgi:hypothetical protein